MRLNSVGELLSISLYLSEFEGISFGYLAPKVITSFKFTSKCDICLSFRSSDISRIQK